MIQQQRGFIPIDVKHQHQEYQVQWLDVGAFRFTKTKFEYAIQGLLATHAAETLLTTNLEPLAMPQLVPDSLYPAGFIFHMSRCGSTLLAKSLARSIHHIVIDEGTPLNDGVWHYLTQGWQAAVMTDAHALQIYRNLVLALGRQRTAEQRAYFVKFRSWNALFADFIIKAFPDVPCLFIYRDPVEVLVSSHWNPVWTLGFKQQNVGAYMLREPLAEIQAMDEFVFLAKIFARYFKTVLQNPSDKLHFLNYDRLTNSNFQTILERAFQYPILPDQLAVMQTQFEYYSKDDNDTTHFISDKAAKQAAATAAMRKLVDQELMDLYRQLEHSDRNLAQWLT
ncbi:MAG: hypothetical protein KF832_14220 [Caldilineaceae bacterium]|nr:hypothetical protein [Caldilineaceae bacterium]